MPTPTPEQIRDAAAAAAAEGVASAQADGQSATAMDPLKQIAAADALAARAALSGAAPGGGSKSGWRLLRPARPILPGAD